VNRWRGGADVTMPASPLVVWPAPRLIRRGSPRTSSSDPW
jgi:hypothetical protein